MRTTMVLWIATKHHLLRQGAKSLHTRNQESGEFWAPHGQHGYPLGPAMHHYRCQNIYILTTASERIVGTLEFFPHTY
jgi:hypothetical protein